MHDEALSVTSMRVCNPDYSPVGINRWDAAPPTAKMPLRWKCLVPVAAGSTSKCQAECELFIRATNNELR